VRCFDLVILVSGCWVSIVLRLSSGLQGYAKKITGLLVLKKQQVSELTSSVYFSLRRDPQFSILLSFTGFSRENFSTFLTHCGRVTQICVFILQLCRTGDANMRFNTLKLGTSASSPLCHFTRGNVSRGITPSNTTRVFGEYFLKISVHKNS
jgi:hypothetical protein